MMMMMMMMIPSTLLLYVEIISGIFRPLYLVDLWKEAHYFLVYALWRNHRFFLFEPRLNSLCFFSNMNFSWSLRRIIIYPPDLRLNLLQRAKSKPNQTTMSLLWVHSSKVFKPHKMGKRGFEPKRQIGL